MRRSQQLVGNAKGIASGIQVDVVAGDAGSRLVHCVHMDQVLRHDGAVGNRACPIDQARREGVGCGGEVRIAARAERHIAAVVAQLRTGHFNARQGVGAQDDFCNAQTQASDALDADLVDGRHIDQRLDAQDAGRAGLLTDVEQGAAANFDSGREGLVGGPNVGDRCQRADTDRTGRARTQVVLLLIAPLVGHVLRADQQCARLHLAVLSNEHLGCTGDVAEYQCTTAGELPDRQVQRGGIKVLRTRSPDVHRLGHQRAAVANASQRRAVDGQIGVSPCDPVHGPTAGSQGFHVQRIVAVRVYAQGLGHQVDVVANACLHIGAAEHRGLGHADGHARAHRQGRSFAQAGLLACGLDNDVARVNVAAADAGFGHGLEHVVGHRAGG